MEPIKEKNLPVNVKTNDERKRKYCDIDEIVVNSTDTSKNSA